jgi:TolA-binding protein
MIRLICAMLIQALATPAAAGAEASRTGADIVEGLKQVDGNETENTKRSLQTELLITGTEEKAVEQLNALIRKHRGRPMEPDLLFRLGELHVRRARSSRFFELYRDNERVVVSTPKSIRDKGSRESILRAVRTFDEIERRFPSYLSMDTVLFNNAIANQQVDQHSRAERLYRKLLDTYPRSVLVPDALLAIGEIHFQRKEWAKALDSFQKIKDHPGSRVYPYGVYKAAWTVYNMRETAQALRELEEVVRFGVYVSQNQIDSRLDLRKEALHDMAVFFSDFLPAKEAYGYFSRQAGELDAGPYIISLTRIYERHARFADRERVLADFLARNKTSVRTHAALRDRIANAESLKERERAVEFMDELVGLCREQSSWSRAMKRIAPSDREADEALKECRPSIVEIALELGQKWQRLWVKSNKNDALAAVAERAFAIYLSHSSDPVEATKARYVYADLLFQRGKFRLASGEYARVAADTTDGKVRHDAGYGAILALEKDVKDKWSDADEKLFNQLAVAYLSRNKNPPFELDIEYKRAVIAYDKGRTGEAAPMLKALGAKFPTQEKGLRAQDLYMDILNAEKRFRDLREYSLALLKSNMDRERRDRVQKLHEQAYFLEVQAMADRGESAEAIAAFQKFARQYPKSDLAEKSWWNSVELQYGTGLVFDAAQSSREYARLFPRAGNVKAALLRAAGAYEDVAELKMASDILLEVAAADPEQEKKWRRLSLQFRMIDGDWSEAEKQLRSQAQSKDPEEKVFALERLVHRARKTARGSVAHLALVDELARTGVEPQAAWAQLEYLEQKFAQGQASEAFQRASRLLGSARTEVGVKAKARLIQARVLEQEYRAQSLVARAERVAMVITLKTEKLDKTTQAYTAVVRYGEPGASVTALERLAGLYADFSRALKTMPAPAGLSPQDEKNLRAELEQLVIPMEEKAIETLAQALEAGRRFGLHDGSVPRLQAELDRLNMRKPRESLVELRAPPIALPTLAEAGL